MKICRETKIKYKTYNKYNKILITFTYSVEMSFFYWGGLGGQEDAEICRIAHITSHLENMCVMTSE